MSLADLMRRQYSAAKTLSLLSSCVQWVLLVGALLALVVRDGGWPLAVSVLALLGPIGAFALRALARYNQSLGERCRRLLYLQEGLGRLPESADLADIAVEVPALQDADPRPLGTFFTSAFPPGPRRLAHILEEAAFYTKKLAGVAAAQQQFFCFVGMAATFLGMWFLVQNPSSVFGYALPPGKELARAATALLVFFATGVFAERSQAFSSLALTATTAYARFDSLRQQDAPDITEVLLTMATYDLAVAKAPVVPTLVYRVLRGRLHTAWVELMDSK